MNRFTLDALTAGKAKLPSLIDAPPVTKGLQGPERDAIVEAYRQAQCPWLFVTATDINVGELARLYLLTRFRSADSAQEPAPELLLQARVLQIITKLSEVALDHVGFKN